MLQYTTSNSRVSGQSAATAGLWMSVFALSYPVLMAVFARVHYALTSRDLSQRTEAGLLLFIFPICLISAFSLMLSLRGEGRTRTAGVVCSITGVALNLFAFLAIGASY
jgi:hypothetical protein